jgi:alkylhydroperoxidase/carboxymuconolactone decarboxylase family protein YurZ
MNFNELMENIKKENGEVPKPIEFLAQLDESLVVNQMGDKKFTFSKESIPQKYKMLIALSAVLALDSPSCILNYVKHAKMCGATVEEIMEAFAIAKFAKAGTTLSSSQQALEWLVNNK